MELTFTPANWASVQVLTVTAEDNDHIQQRRTTTTINFVASGGDYKGVGRSLALVVIDDEPESTTITLSLLDESLQKLEQLEEGSGPVRVYVAAETSTTIYADVPIVMGPFAGEAGFIEYSLTPVGAPLRILAGEKSGMAQFWLTPTDDGIDEDDETVDIFGRARGDAANLIASIAPASFRIIDNDTRTVIVTPTGVTVPEGGGRRTYSVRLGSQPAGGDVLVEITGVARITDQTGQEGRTLRFFRGPVGGAKITSASNGDFTPIGDGIVLTFTAANWFEEQLVYVDLPSNDLVQVNSIALVEHSVSGGDYDDVEVPDVVLTLTEFGFVVSALTNVADGALSEGGSAVYSIYLRSQPAHPVTMRVRLPPNPGITLTSDPEELIFSTENWGMNQARFVTVTYEQDNLSNGDRTLEIAHIAVSDDPDWDSGGDPVAVVSVNSIDDDDLPILRLLLSPSNAVEGDGGSDGSQRRPTIEVMVTAELDGPARSEETIISLSFGRNGDTAGPGDYTTTLAADAFLGIPQEAVESTDGTQHTSVAVMLTLNRDFLDEEDETFTITGSAAGLSDGSATFTIMDHPDDERDIEIGEIPPEVTEGGAISYTLVLQSRPLEAVTVELSTASDEVALSPSLLVFSTMNWHIPQDITVSAMDNSISEGSRTVEITYAVRGEITTVFRWLHRL